MTMSKLYNITGRVVDQDTSQGIPGLKIEAWDKDISDETNTFSGQLFDKKKNTPLAGYTVRFIVLDKRRLPRVWGQGTTDKDGFFAVKPTVSVNLPAKSKQSLLLQVVFDKRKDRVYEREVEFVAGEINRMGKIELEVPDEQEPPTTIAKLDEVLALNIPPTVHEKLAEKGIRTLDDVRSKGGIGQIEGLDLPEDDPLRQTIDAHAFLSVAVSDSQEIQKLVKKGYPSLHAIARTNQDRFIDGVKEEVGEVKAASIHAKVVAQTSVLNNLLVGHFAERANGYALVSGPMRDIDLPEPPCQCRDCESAVSPLAYLADLLRYAMDHMTLNDNELKISDLRNRLCQPFDGLPASCEAVEKRVRQVRIAVEVLRQRTDPSTLVDEAYCLDAYQNLLLRLGTSLEEIRLAYRADTQTKQRIADKLGLDDVSRLDDLRIEPEDLSERKIQEIFGLANTRPGEHDPLAEVPVPRIEEWRLNFLRALWKKEDWPDETLAENQPVIDPDIIGPDDLRWPFPDNPVRAEGDPNRVYLLWRKRREWVDSRRRELEQLTVQIGREPVPDMQAMLGSMLNQVAYETERITPWPETGTLERLDSLHVQLSTGSQDQVDRAIQRVEKHLALTPDAFCRLIELKHKHEAWLSGASDDRLTPDEWRDFRSILVQAQKERLYTFWQEEETAQSITLSTEDFWIPAQEPAVGAWPPASLGQAPLIDPERNSLKDLPERKAGARAREIWQARKTELATIAEDLRKLLPDHHAALLAALGDPDPGDPASQILPHDLEELTAELASPHPEIRAAAEKKIQDYLHMSLEDFARLMAVLRKYQLSEPGQKPTEIERRDFVRILTSAQKQKRAYPQWLQEEQDTGNPVPYWYARKAMLPPWRASLEQRVKWQNTLRSKSLPPIIDPDLIDAGDIARPIDGDPAYELWKERHNDVEEALKKITQKRIRDGLEVVLITYIHTTGQELKALAQDEQDGYSIDAYLKQLRLSRPAFNQLLTMVRLLEQNEPVLASEWEEVDAILLQTWKESMYSQWRKEEQSKHLTLSPDHFVVERVADRDLPKWRAQQGALRDWQDKLQARFDQQAAIREGIQKAISDTESAVLPRLRDALIRSTTSGSVEDAADVYSRRYFISMRESGCHITTRVSQAIVSLQGLLMAARMETLPSTCDGLKLEAPSFDENWKWMGSYATWRAAMFVFLYPENLLVPTLRRDSTPEMEPVTTTLGDQDLSMEDLQTAVASYSNYLNSISSLSVEAQCVAALDRVGGTRRLFVFGANRDGIYWIGYDIERAVDGSDRAITPPVGPWAKTTIASGGTILGAQPYYPPLDVEASGNGYLYVFLRTSDDDRIAFTRTLITPTLAVAGSQANWSPLEYYEPSDWTEPLDWMGGDHGIVLQGPVDARNSNAPCLVALLPQKLNATSFWPETANALYKVRLGMAGAEWGEREYIGKLSPDAELQLFSSSPQPVGVEWRSVPKASYVDYWVIAQTDGDITFKVETPAQNYVDLYVRRGNEPARSGNGNHDLMIEQIGHDNYASSQEITLDNVSKDDRISVGIYGRHKGVWWMGTYSEDTYDGPDSPPPIEFNLTATADVPWETHYLEDVVKTGGYFPTRVVTCRESGNLSKWQIWRKTVTRWERLELFDSSDGEYTRTTTLTGGPSGIAVFWYSGGVSRSMILNWDATEIITSNLESASGPSALIRKWNGGNLLVARRTNDLAGPLQPDAEAEEWALLRLGAPDEGWYQETDQDLIIPAYVFPVAQPSSSESGEVEVIREAQRRFLEDLRARSPSWAIYAAEAAYFVPMLVGLRLHQAGHYIEALAWFRCVYDYTAPDGQRKTYPGLSLEEALTDDYQLAKDWFEDPLNPHAIAATRENAYSRYTIMTIAQCLIGYADSEFARDTVESLPRALDLYLHADRLLKSPELVQGSSECDEIMGQLEINLGVLGHSSSALSRRVRERIESTSDRASRRAMSERITEILGTEESQAAKASLVWSAVEEHTARPVSNVAQILASRSEVTDGLYNAVMSSDLMQAKVNSIMASREMAPAVGDRLQFFLSSSAFGFCVPQNPMADILRTKVETNLAKLRTCRNIAGVTRAVEPFAAPTDTRSGMPYLAGGQTVLPGIAAVQPSQYRYKTLAAKADQLLTFAQQMEASLLAALEKGAQAKYNIFKARQELSMAKAGVKLQETRVTEAEQGVGLAQVQRQSAQTRRDYYQELVDGGLSDWEIAALASETAAVAHLHTAAGIKQAFTFGIGGIGDVGGALSATASLLKTQASYERRMQEWQFQLDLASNDIELGNRQIDMARVHVGVVTEEKRIAELSVQNAQDTLEFLNSEFDKPELYRWMGNVLRQIYAYFLQQAASMAQAASNQLAFERQEPLPSFIRTDYWEIPTQTQITGAKTDEERKGLLGAERLRADLEKLNLYAFKTDERRLHLSKSISLAALSPWEFARFRESGVLHFATPMSLFDRDHPGHYMRLIHNVKVSVVGLIPPVAGIHATLTSDRISRVVVGGDLYQVTQIAHGPNQVALSSPQESSGVFELDPQSEILRPFEGIGVDTAWEFRMPKPSNQIDYDAIADVIVTIEYTALNSFDFRQQVIESLPRRFRADRAFSFQYDLPDQWYQLHNPEQSSTPMTVRFETDAEQFPANLGRFSMADITLYFSSQQGTTFEVEMEHLRFQEQGQQGWIGGSALTVEKTVSTRRSNGASWTPLQGRSPFGVWEMALPNSLAVRELFGEGKITDILLVITYTADTPGW
jgi:hypothetical protein